MVMNGYGRAGMVQVGMRLNRLDTFHCTTMRAKWSSAVYLPLILRIKTCAFRNYGTLRAAIYGQTDILQRLLVDTGINVHTLASIGYSDDLKRSFASLSSIHPIVLHIPFSQKSTLAH